MYVRVDFEEATIYNKIIKREEALLFEPPSYIILMYIHYTVLYIFI